MTAAYAIAVTISSLSTPATPNTVTSMIAADELGAQMYTVQHTAYAAPQVASAGTGWWSMPATTVVAAN